MIKIPKILGHTAVVRASCVYDYKCLHFLYSVRHSKSITKAKYKKQQKIIFLYCFILFCFSETLCQIVGVIGNREVLNQKSQIVIKSCAKLEIFEGLTMDKELDTNFDIDFFI